VSFFSFSSHARTWCFLGHSELSSGVSVYVTPFRRTRIVPSLSGLRSGTPQKQRDNMQIQRWCCWYACLSRSSKTNWGFTNCKNSVDRDCSYGGTRAAPAWKYSNTKGVCCQGSSRILFAYCATVFWKRTWRGLKHNSTLVWTFDVSALLTNVRSIRLPAASERPVLMDVERFYRLYVSEDLHDSKGFGR
jgi:hypothetical protein